MCDKCKEYEDKVYVYHGNELEPPAERLKQSLEEMNQMRKGEIPKHSLKDLWKVFAEEEWDS